jgi:hypothetical protein
MANSAASFNDVKPHPESHANPSIIVNFNAMQEGTVSEQIAMILDTPAPEPAPSTSLIYMDQRATVATVSSVERLRQDFGSSDFLS